MNHDVKKVNNFKKGKHYNKDAKEAKNIEILQKQTKSLELIDTASEFLNEYYNDENRENRFTIEEVKDYLVKAGYTFDDFKFVGYQSHPALKAPLSVGNPIV